MELNFGEAKLLKDVLYRVIAIESLERTVTDEEMSRLIEIATKAEIYYQDIARREYTKLRLSKTQKGEEHDGRN